jgi:hypothetical protein
MILIINNRRDAKAKRNGKNKKKIITVRIDIINKQNADDTD